MIQKKTYVCCKNMTKIAFCKFLFIFSILFHERLIYKFNTMVRFILQYFDFSKKEAYGFLILTGLLLVISAFPFIMHWFITPSPLYSRAELALIDSLEAQLDQHQHADSTQTSYFEFDPNHLSRDSLLLLGLNPVVVENIIKYRKAGGTFRVKEDFGKIYNLDEETYNKLRHLLLLPGKHSGETAKNNSGKIPKFDINKATAEQLRQIRGIGEVYSERIVKFRYVLGGFFSLEQLQEVYGISDFAYDNCIKSAYIAQDFEPRKIRINSWSAEKLGRHPYIDEKLAREIVQMREKNIFISEAEDLDRYDNVNDAVKNKLLPYIEFD